MRRFWTLLTTLSICLSATCISQSVELVESIPTETTLDNPDIRDTREVWLEMIGSSRATLDIEQFYIAHSPGKAMEDIIGAILQAARRGVQVRILVDAGFSVKYPDTLDSLAKVKNISVRKIDFRSKGRGVQHAKFFIVDGRSVFVGSQNFDWRALDHIHEIGLKVEEPSCASAYAAVFQRDWTSAVGESGSVAIPCPPAISSTVTTSDGTSCILTPVFSPLSTLADSACWDLYGIVKLLDEATSSIGIQVLSYSPVEGREYFEVLENALRRASVRGVKVRMIVSDWSLGARRIGYLKSLSLFPNLDLRISSIPEASQGFISFARVEHCKYLVVDGKAAWVGTSNWSRDYFLSSRNAGFLIKGGVLPRQLERVFLKSWESAYVKPMDVSADYIPRKTDDGSGI